MQRHILLISSCEIASMLCNIRLGESIYSQLEAVKREVDNGTDGIIVQWVSSDVDIEKLEVFMEIKQA